MTLATDIFLALLLTLPAGGALIRRFLNTSTMNPALVIGTAFFLGLLVDIAGLNTLQWLPFSVNVRQALVVLASLHLLALVYLLTHTWHGLSRYQLKQGRAKAYFVTTLTTLIRRHWLCLILLTVALAIVLVNLQMSSRLPVLAWDAWSGWVAKAKVWHTQGIGAPIVSPEKWLIQGKKQVLWASHMWHYPDAIGLLYAVFAAFDTSIEPGASVLWPLASAFLGLAIAGYLAGKNNTLCNRPSSLLAAILLMITPLWWQHSVFAGYADLILASYLWLSVAHYTIWQQTRQKTNRLLAGIFLLSLPFIKLFGWVAILVFLLANAWQQSRNRGRTVLALVGAVSILSFVLWMFLPLSFQTPVGHFSLEGNQWVIPGFGIIRWGFYGNIWPWLEGFLFSHNWLLLWLATPVLIWHTLRDKQAKPVSTFGLVLLFYLFVLICLYSLTGFSRFAETFTSSNRMILHVYPLLLTGIFLLLDTSNNKKAEKSALMGRKSLQKNTGTR